MLRAFMARARIAYYVERPGSPPLLCTAACLLLGSCAGSRTSATPPGGLSLAGTWRLDPAASDDPQKILSHMRAEALKIINRNIAQAQARVDSGSAPADTAAVIDAPALRRDPLGRSTAAHILRAVSLRYRSRSDRLRLRDLAAGFTPGAQCRVGRGAASASALRLERARLPHHHQTQQGPEVTIDSVRTATLVEASHR
jgi:hypothetical protein